MTFVIHPLTQQSGEPKYTANDFRLTVSNFLTAATGETFGAVQGVRSDSFDTHASMSGSTITVHPHSGIIAPWSGVGAYAYAITSDITVPRPTTGDYYVVLVVEDPSQSHGSEPQGRVDLIPASTPRASIDGLVIAQTVGTSINDIATRLRNGTVIETVSKSELDLIKPTARTKGFVRFGDGMGEYEYNGSNWVYLPKAPVVKAGTISAKSSPGLAVIKLNYASPNGKPPDSLVVSLGPFGVEESAKQASVMVWSATAEEAQIRVRRNYDGAWWTDFQATISWIAVWNA